MASVFRRTRSYPIPDGATIVANRRGDRFAKWTDGKGRTRREPLNEAGDRIVVPAKTYTITYVDENGKPQTVNAETPDRDVAEQIANKIENDVALRRRGIVIPDQERIAREAARPLKEHLQDFRADLEARQSTEKHVRMTCNHIETVGTACRAARITDLTPAVVMQAIHAQRQNGSSLRTCNSYLRSVKSFTRWLRKDRRTADDALEGLSQFNADTDRRHVRRALDDEEIAYLLRFVEGHTLPMHNLPGPDRAMVYRLALGTGFRAKELRNLRPESFDLDANPPTVTVAAGCSKRRREDRQPIRLDLADLLRPWLAEKESGERLFGRLPGGTARMLRSDLAAAREAWLKEAPIEAVRQAREKTVFLCYKNAAGEVADFHATRHTYISGLVAGGASVKTAQELARHSTPVLTIGRYAHTRRQDLQKALESLPSLTSKPSQGPTEHAETTNLDGGVDSISPVNRHSRSGETCESEARRGEPGDAYRGGEEEGAVKPQLLALSALREDSAPCGDTRRDVKIERRRSDSNRRWRICNPLP